MLAPHPPPRRRAYTSGFTLVEALVAVGLTSILLWGLLQLYTSATRFSSTCTLEAELCSAGRAALETLSDELSQAIRQHEGCIRVTNAQHDSEEFDSIQFVADNPADGQPIHVGYATIEQDGRRWLGRATNTSSPFTTPRTLSSYHSLGLYVERLNITYDYTKVSESGGTWTAESFTNQTGTLTFPNEFESSSTYYIPTAFHIELRLSDRKDRATITL